MAQVKPTILFLNPPHSLSILRRYMCSYHSPKYLLPPHDLIQLATCIRAWNDAEVLVVDAIALGYTEAKVFQVIEDASPDMLVALVGVEIFGDDMMFMGRLKLAFPNLPCAVFGYYPAAFPLEVLQHSAADYVLCGEPEQPLSDCLDAHLNGLEKQAIAGLAGRRTDGSFFNNPAKRFEPLDRLPFPDYTLIDLNVYEEAFFGKRVGAILASRGCPFSCTYCTTTYGRRLVMKSPDTVAAEMDGLLRAGARVIRFMDDTFTCNRQWVMDLCRLLIAREVRIPWSCSARVDMMDEELLTWMRRAGCERILVGVESYSKNILSQLRKGIEPATTNAQLALIRKAGIQIVGHFIVGAPFETDADFEETIKGARASPLDFIIVNILTPYAGTPYFEQVADLIEFSLFPYKCAYKDPVFDVIAKKRYNRLYLNFYLRPVVWWRQFSYLARHPLRALQILMAFVR